MTEDVIPIPGAPPGPPPERVPFWSYGDLLVFILLAFPSFLVAFMVWGAIVFLAGINASTKAMQALPPQFLGYAIWFLLLALLLKTRYNRPFWRSINWTFPRGAVLPAIASGMLLAAGTAILSVVLRARQIESPMMDLMKDPRSLMLLGAAAVTVGPICEEILFRGFLMPLLIRSLGVFAGIVLSSALFATLHGQQNAWSWQHVLLIGLAGCAFGWARYRTGSTAVAALMHSCYNFMFFFALIAAQRGLIRN